MQEYTVLYRGAAIATLRGEFVDDMGGGDVLPLPAFDAVRQIIADACRTHANLGFLPPNGALVGGVSAEGSRAGDESLRAADDVCDDLELRDAHGRLLQTDWIWVYGGRTPDDPIGLMASLRNRPGTTPASMPRPPVEDAGRSRRQTNVALVVLGSSSRASDSRQHPVSFNQHRAPVGRAHRHSRGVR